MPGSVPHDLAVIIGPDGSGRTHALDELAGTSSTMVVRIRPTPFDREMPLGGLRALLGPDDADPQPHRIAERLPEGCLVLVDDAHLLEASSLRLLAGLARAGVRVVAAHAPLDDPVLAAFDEILLDGRRTSFLGPLDEEAVAGVVVSVTGRAAPTELVSRLLEDCAGFPALVAAAATEPDAEVPQAIAERVRRRRQQLDPQAAALLDVMSLAGDLPDRVLAGLAGVDTAEHAAAVGRLAAAGLLVPGAEKVVPVVARAVLADIPGPRRRSLDAALGRALLELGVDVLVAATHLRRAGAAGPEAASTYAAAGDRLRFEDPEAALGWYDAALDAGADPGQVTAGRAEAAAAAGTALPEPGELDDATTRARLRVARAVVAVRDGRWPRAVELLEDVADHDLGPSARLLSVPAFVAVGDIAAAEEAAATPVDLASGSVTALAHFASAALAAGRGDPDTVPRFVEAAEAAERHAGTAPLLATPHSLGALTASRLGDTEAAEQLARRALDLDLGGPATAVHHQLVHAWVRMRAGRYDTAVQTCRSVRDTSLEGRDRLLLAALEAGLGRRSGDIARLRGAWEAASEALIRQAVDLWAMEPIGELLLAAARLRQTERAEPVLAGLAAMVEATGPAVTWDASFQWLRLELAVATEDGTAADAAAARLAALAPGDRRRPVLAGAAAVWSDVLREQVDAERVVSASTALAGTGLPWEASRLAGQAAIRSTDPSVARRLLEQARDLFSGEVPGDPTAEGREGSADTDGTGLSERELAVARFVADGLTYKEIGAQLYISPKTVEHHVARIRAKVGASTRAEMLAAIRALLETADEG